MDESIYAVARVVVRASASPKREGDLFVGWRTVAGASGSNRFHLPGEEYPRSAVVAPAGGLFVGGRKTGSADGTAVRGDADGFVAHLDERGGLDWIRFIGSPGDDLVLALTPGPDGSVFAAGAMGAGPRLGRRTGRAFVARYSAAGELLWRLDGARGAGWVSAATLAGGSVAVAGWRLTTEGRESVVALVTAEGALAWERSTFAGSLTSLTAAGDLLIAAGTIRQTPAISGAALRRGFVRAYEPDGTLAWTTTVPSTGADRIGAIVGNPDGSMSTTLYAFTDLDLRPFSGWGRFGEPPTSGAGPARPGFAGPLLALYDAGGSLIAFESLPAWPVTLGPGGSVFTATRDGGNLIVRRLR